MNKTYEHKYIKKISKDTPSRHTNFFDEMIKSIPINADTPHPQASKRTPSLVDNILGVVLFGTAIYIAANVADDIFG